MKLTEKKITSIRTESAGKYLENSQDYFLLAHARHGVGGFQLSAGDFKSRPSSQD
jgi:hypothetical protein